MSFLKKFSRGETADGYDPYKLSSPQVFLLSMLIFLAIVAFIAVILTRQISSAFATNPGLNGLIAGVLLVGILLAFGQVARLFREVRWVNSFRAGSETNEPVLLAPMKALLSRSSSMALSTNSMRTMLDSIANRLDESRDVSRYLVGLLVFLGLLGTFWGLLADDRLDRRHDPVPRSGLGRHLGGARIAEGRACRRRLPAWAPPSRRRCSAFPARWCWASSTFRRDARRRASTPSWRTGCRRSPTFPPTSPAAPEAARVGAADEIKLLGERLQALAGERRLQPARRHRHGQSRRRDFGPGQEHAQRTADHARLGRSPVAGAEGAARDPRPDRRGAEEAGA